MRLIISSIGRIVTKWDQWKTPIGTIESLLRTTGPSPRSGGAPVEGWGDDVAMMSSKKLKLSVFRENWHEVQIRYGECDNLRRGHVAKIVAKDNIRGKLRMDFAKDRYGY